MAEARSHLAMAHAAYAGGAYPEARDACRKALESEPDNPEAWLLHGVLARRQGDLDTAMKAYAEALRLRPDYPEACFNLGNALAAVGRAEEAVAQLERAVAILPGFAAAWSSLGSQRLQLNRIIPGIAAQTQAATLAPGEADVWNNLGRGYWMAGEVAAAVASFRKSLALSPDNVVAHDNLLTLLHYDPSLNAADLLAEHQAWNRRHAEPLRRAPVWDTEHDADPERKLRVGLVSWNFRRDAAGCFIGSILHGFDRDRFTLLAYSDNPGKDAYSEDFRGQVDFWVETHGLDDQAFAQRVRADRIDILLDLTGHTGRSRLLAFARRLAPVQISWIGYEGTTGLAEMDWLVGDWQVTPKGAEAETCEGLIRLPHAFQCFMPPPDAPAVAPPPAVKNSYITFGCFNKPAKLNAGVLDLWAALLKRVPEARLLLKSAVFDDPALADLFRQRFEQRGVARERVILRGASPYLTMLAEYGDLDIALDPFPFSGGATTCDALWMGVPVVTRRGHRFAANHTVSHLSACGFPQWVAEDADEYLEIAVALAADVAGLADLRRVQRDLVATSPLCAAKPYMTMMQLHLRRIWRDWCRRMEQGQ